MMADLGMQVWTDGACTGNGTPQAKGGVGVYIGPQDPRNLSRPLDMEAPHTNNKAELRAIQLGLDVIEKQHPARAILYSDSDYAIKSLTQYIKTWRRNGWLSSKGEPVCNQEIIQEIDSQMARLEHLGTKLQLQHVRGHTGRQDGNFYADQLATEAIRAPGSPPSHASERGRGRKAIKADHSQPTHRKKRPRLGDLVQSSFNNPPEDNARPLTAARGNADNLMSDLPSLQFVFGRESQRNGIHFVLDRGLDVAMLRFLNVLRGGELVVQTALTAEQQKSACKNLKALCVVASSSAVGVGTQEISLPVCECLEVLFRVDPRQVPHLIFTWKCSQGSLNVELSWQSCEEALQKLASWLGSEGG
jgi:ribonuclease HI